MKAKRYPQGSVETTETGVVAKRWFSKETIPFTRITAVERAGLVLVRIETGAKTHKFQLWSPGAAKRLVEDIEQHLAA